MFCASLNLDKGPVTYYRAKLGEMGKNICKLKGKEVKAIVYGNGATEHLRLFCKDEKALEKSVKMWRLQLKGMK